MFASDVHHAGTFTDASENAFPEFVHHGSTTNGFGAESISGNGDWAANTVSNSYNPQTSGSGRKGMFC